MNKHMLYRNNIQRGFTVVEMAVVIVVLTVLAAITYVGYDAWQDRVAVTEVKSDLTGVQGAMESHRNFSNAYPTGLPDGFTGSDGVELTYVRGGGGEYCIEAQSERVDTVKMHITGRSGAVAQEGACPVVPLGVPTIASVGVVGTDASVVWGAVSGATTYEVQTRVGTQPWVTATEVSGTSASIGGLTPSTAYDFRVRTKNITQESGWSSVVQRVVVPTPVITATTNLGCGNNGGAYAWLNLQMSWTATSRTYTASYEVNYASGGGVVTVPNPAGSGTLSTAAVSSSWEANLSGSGSSQVWGVGPNGERSSPATWTSSVYAPYYC